MTDLNVIDLQPQGEARTRIDLEGVSVVLVTRFNYAAKCWTMDIIRSNGERMMAGLMLVPGIDILKLYPQQKKLLGTMRLIEKNPGDYKSPDLLGINTKLVWEPPEGNDG